MRLLFFLSLMATMLFGYSDEVHAEVQHYCEIESCDTVDVACVESEVSELVSVYTADGVLYRLYEYNDSAKLDYVLITTINYTTVTTKRIELTRDNCNRYLKYTRLNLPHLHRLMYSRLCNSENV